MPLLNLHCFAGCPVQSVLDAIGLKFTDLMPERLRSEHRYKPMRQRFDARAVLECVTHEVTVVCLLAEKMQRRETLTDSDDQRLTLAAQRINAALDYTPPLKMPELRNIRSGA